MSKVTEEINGSIYWDTLPFALYQCV